MKLVIGGYAQGKRAYVEEMIQGADAIFCDGRLYDGHCKDAWIIVDHLHHWVRNCLSEGMDFEEQMCSFLEKYPKVIFICDEIGNGIVPMEPFERMYREETGRLLIKIAKIADEVIRIVCGIGQKIK